MSVVGLRKGDYTIEIIGEDHSARLPATSIFTRIIRPIIESNCLVLLEHSTMLCNIRGIQPHMERYMKTFGGLDSVFLDLMKQKRKYKNMECVDILMREGMLTSIDEKRLRTRLSSVRTPSPENILESFEILAVLLDTTQHVTGKIIPMFVASVYEKEVVSPYTEAIEIQQDMLYTCSAFNRIQVFR